jgi:hypothetical protein
MWAISGKRRIDFYFRFFAKFTLERNAGSPLGGGDAYDALKMFKAMVLQAWHRLSDPEPENSL